MWAHQLTAPSILNFRRMRKGGNRCFVSSVSTHFVEDQELLRGLRGMISFNMVLVCVCKGQRCLILLLAMLAPRQSLDWNSLVFTLNCGPTIPVGCEEQIANAGPFLSCEGAGTQTACPRLSCGGGEREPGTYCLYVHKNFQKFFL